ncbi:hypothetical protein RvY_06820 [Ramazzottius varieornatus]|uniref:Protein kinase domain-containing protein n=1 Tax=Ramazzottius varieornatus TaxID=947166 RepID=A0A1D1V373_RAMVA|nr:hypothetical protein RvY_06820 [Ramazzottius varieornatus]
MHFLKCVLVILCVNSPALIHTDGTNVLREIFRDDFNLAKREPSPFRWNTIERLRTAETRYNAEVDGVCVADGSLKLSVSSNRTTYILAETSGKFRFRFGEVEARLRAPHGKGLVSKLILVRDSCSLLSCTDSIEDTYPRMYIVELSGVSPFTEASVRSDFYINIDNRSVRGDVNQAVNITGQNLFNDFHDYRMVWTNDSLTWFIDGVKIFETTDGKAIAQDFMRLELSMYIATGRGGGWPDEHTHFPAVFEIDYVVVRQENPYTEPDLLLSADFTKTISAEFLGDHFIYGTVDNSKTFTQLSSDTVRTVNNSLRLSCLGDAGQKTQYRVTLQSVGRFDYLYGELSFRARFPSAQENSPYAVVGIQNYLCGPGKRDGRPRDCAAEVSLNQEPGRPLDNHVQLFYSNPLSPDDVQPSKEPLAQSVDLSRAFHTYNLSWTPSKLTWFLDDKEVLTVTDVKKIPNVRMFIYFTLFCDSTNDDNESLETSQLMIESVSVRQLVDFGEIEQIHAYYGWSGWKYGVVFGLLGITLLLVIALCFMIMKKRREKERLGWKSRDNLSLRRSLTAENAYLTRVIPIPSSADIYRIPPENLSRSDTILGRGEHGIVFKGTATGLYGKSGPTVVAIKTLLSTEEDSSADKAFFKELDVLAKCGHHLNIVNLLGVVTIGRPSLLLEYCQYGSLLGYLREHRPPFYFNHVDSEGNLLLFDKAKYETQSNNQYGKLKANTYDQALLSTRDLINFAYQIARGMEYLASRPIVHRDLAARNILVDKGKIVKISDFGMARHEGEYLLQDGSIPLPIRWMSPTAILNKTFNQSTDVWSYGVVLWEMFALGELPYGDRKIGGDIEKFVQEVIEGAHLQKPDFCPDDLYQLMKDCWSLSPDAPSPTFKGLKDRLDTLITSDVAEYYTNLDAPYEQYNKDHQYKQQAMDEQSDSALQKPGDQESLDFEMT